MIQVEVDMADSLEAAWAQQIWHQRCLKASGVVGGLAKRNPPFCLEAADYALG
jgi:hypothetical protein